MANYADAFSSDLNRIKESEEAFDENKVSLLVDCMESGMTMYDEIERSLVKSTTMRRPKGSKKKDKSVDSAPSGSIQAMETDVSTENKENDGDGEKKKKNKLKTLKRSKEQPAEDATVQENESPKKKKKKRNKSEAEQEPATPAKTDSTPPKVKKSAKKSAKKDKSAKKRKVEA